MSAVAIIPARGGSVRIPRKNIKPFRGRPIICYSIETAQNSGLFSAVIVTTDDMEIAEIALKAGAAVIWREPDDGTKGTQEVAADVLRKMPGIDMACVIYATAPLLNAQDLRVGLEALNGRQFTFSVGTEPLADAGGFYWGWAKAFTDGTPLLAHHTALVPLPKERVCDINDESDWAKAEQLFDAMRGK